MASIETDFQNKTINYENNERKYWLLIVFLKQNNSKIINYFDSKSFEQRVGPQELEFTVRSDKKHMPYGLTGVARVSSPGLPLIGEPLECSQRFTASSTAITDSVL